VSHLEKPERRYPQEIARRKHTGAVFPTDCFMPPVPIHLLRTGSGAMLFFNPLVFQKNTRMTHNDACLGTGLSRGEI
jgi:hypothetical protein